MSKYLWTAIPVLLLAAMLQAGAQDQTKGNTAPPSRTLKVKLNYTGNGMVDAKHPILVFVFDSPDFRDGQLPPIAQDTAKAKDETLVFKDLTASPVYIAAVYDPSGTYEGDSMPPAGSSIGMYEKTPGVPAPINIEAGKTAEVDLPFDDSHKMQ
jgi:hypothetical protein